MKALRTGLNNVAIIKLRSSQFDKLSNIINALNLLKHNHINIIKTSQLYRDNDYLFSYVKFEFNQDKTIMLETVKNLLSVTNYCLN